MTSHLRPVSFAVIGAGFSGALLAVHLMQRCRPEDTIALIEKRPGFGRGLAYSTGNASHLLNVRAGNMSAFPEQPDHFVRWLEDRRRDLGGVAPSADSFASRKLYGAYVQSLLSEELWRGPAAATLNLVPEEAVLIEEHENGAIVTLGSGNRVEADAVVVATGNLPPDRSVGAYFGNPWDRRAVAGLPPDAPVLLIGSGLTMIDVVLSLLDEGLEGPISAVSRRGLLPQVHAPTAALDIGVDDLPSTTSVVRMTQWLRELAREAERAGDGWRAVVDGVRPFVPDLWRKLPLDERRRFLRHLRPYWDIHRHRLAPDVDARITAAMTSGQLSVSAGRILSITPRDDGDGVLAAIRRRGVGEIETLAAARVINCSGPETNYEACSAPLLRSLLKSGLARPDPLRLGLDVTEYGALLDREGAPSKRVFALGPVTRGVFWEVVAVPDIRTHCSRLARHLAEQVTPAVRLRPLRAASG